MCGFAGHELLDYLMYHIADWVGEGMCQDNLVPKGRAVLPGMQTVLGAAHQCVFALLWGIR